jgi:UDP-N-acetylglucosamine--N-acetylmuramyl-(pentapeptide) pyrophosphoryl-undecaprenol N-acetylglucosamine transferase
MKKILIAAGGSGGHIFPAVALARRIKEKVTDCDILFVGSDKSLDKGIFQKEGLKFALLSSNKLPYKKSFKTILFFLGLFFDSVRSLFIVASYKPSVVVGFGGYVSSPVSVAAYILGIPVVAHEQNVVPGRANKILFRLASKIAVSFSETKESMGPLADKAIYTGNPIRANLYKNDRAGSVKRLGLEPGKFTILVIGGSQGARGLNEKFLAAVSNIDDKTKAALQVIHITGMADYTKASREYERIGLDHRVYSFVDQIEDAYSASDLVVTRSGASAIFELALFGKPMILVPYPFAMSHQTENARVFSKRGAAIEMAEKELSPEDLKNRMIGLLNDPLALEGLGCSARGMSVPDASDRLADAVLGAAKRS